MGVEIDPGGRTDIHFFDAAEADRDKPGGSLVTLAKDPRIVGQIYPQCSGASDAMSGLREFVQ